MAAKKFNAMMFDKLKEVLKKTEKTNSSFANFIRFPAGHTYTLRLIPNLENIDDTFFHHYLNQWTSEKDGSFISLLSLRSFGEKDPIYDARWKLWKEWKKTEPDKDEKFDNPLKEKEQWLVNVYVVDDPSEPENNGTVKILPLGPQLKEIVDNAMNERADEFGEAIFDLSKDGCDFKIVAEKQGQYTTYKKSYFTSKSKLKLSDEEVEKVYEQMHDLKQIYTAKTYEELKELLEEHFYCKGGETKSEPKKQLSEKTVEKAKPKAKEKTPPKEEVVDDDDDDIPMDYPESDSLLGDIINELNSDD